MPIDPHAALQALLRAEAARTAPLDPAPPETTPPTPEEDHNTGPHTHPKDA
ncbi:hypothetical protein [Streptomyces sp. NPDC002564]|uniref:hypothetical protein n=1 Tax=Streptomyces sp. NPDC002564 TaxID=3364649 RepID=UPI0036B590BD